MQVFNYQLIPEQQVKQLGLIVLQSDVTIEDEFRDYFSGLPISLLASRIPFENVVTVETLKQMQQHIGSSVALFPSHMQFEAIGYGCTSGALHIGGDRIEQIIGQQRECRYTTDPLKAAIAAFKHIGARNIAYLAPYSQAVAQTMVDGFEQHGIKVALSATFDEDQDVNVGRISPDSIYAAAVELCHQTSVDAVFIACTNMKCAQIIPKIERETGICALSSNLVLAWHMAYMSDSLSTAEDSLESDSIRSTKLWR